MTFSFLSIPVTIRGSFWFLAVLFAFSRIEQPLLVIEWVCVMGLAILIHELGHALAFRFYGHRPAIELHGMGGLTHSLGGTQRLGPGRDAVITFAGPFAGYVLALLVWGATKIVTVPPAPDFWGILVADLLWTSAGWSTLNLCPMLPLDGGLLLLAGLRARFGARAQLFAHIISLLVAVAAMAASRWAGWTWTLYMSVWFAAQNGQALIALLQKPKASVDKTAVSLDKRDPLFLKAQALACATWLRRGDLQRAWDAAKDLPDEALGPELLKTLSDALFTAKQWPFAEHTAARRFTAFKDAAAAIDAARAASADSRTDDCWSWLQRAASVGFTNFDSIKNDPYFATLTSDARWGLAGG